MTTLDELKAQGLCACVLGYTGEVGKALVAEIARLKVFRRVVLVGRREVDMGAVGPEFEQKTVDFENLTDHKQVFDDVNVTFCCLGTTRGKAGKDGFIRVDRDFVLSAASVSQTAGCRHFALVSSQGANPSSSLLYPRIKGEVEEKLKSMKFERLSIYRPGLLLCDRSESRPGEAVLRFLMKPVAFLFPTAGTVPVSVVAKAMIFDLCEPSRQVAVYENKEIHRLPSRAC